MATHSSILAWSIRWTEEPGGLQSTGLQRVEHGWAHRHHHHAPCSLAFSTLLETPVDTVAQSHRTTRLGHSHKPGQGSSQQKAWISFAVYNKGLDTTEQLSTTFLMPLSMASTDFFDLWIPLVFSHWEALAGDQTNRGEYIEIFISKDPSLGVDRVPSLKTADPV